SSEPTNLDADEAVHEERGDSVERVATTTASLDAEQDSGNINRTQSTAIPNVPFPQGIGSGGSPPGVNTSGSDEERIELKELMDMYTKLSDRVLDLENVKDAQALEIKKLKKRVKELERRNKSRTPQQKRRVYKPRVESSKESLGEKDASKQGRNSDKTEELNVAKDEHMFDLSELAGTEVIADQEETTGLVEDKGFSTDLSIIITILRLCKNIRDSLPRSERDLVKDTDGLILICVDKTVTDLRVTLRVINSPCFLVKSWLVQDQTVLGKDYSNLLIADSLLKTIWFINAPCYDNEALASPNSNDEELSIPEQTATGKGTSNPLMADKDAAKEG
ncbi:hypothetical protein Tco_1088623, partial [Tanacetum coccineum]